MVASPFRQAFRRSRRAFTLVELLVVVGIIALLIAMLMPTLGAAKAQASVVACLSNVRQIAVAAQMYANGPGRRAAFHRPARTGRIPA